MNVIASMMEGVRNGFVGRLFKEGIITTRLLVLGGLGVILLIAGGVFDSIPQPVKSGVTDTPKPVQSVSRSYEEALEGKLAHLLSQVKGAGTVSVNIILESSGSIEHAKNIVKETKTIQEKDNSGGIRTTTEAKESEQVLISREGGADRPVTVREHKPVIKGVLVVADGAQDSSVKANLTRAVETGLGIPSYKVTVLPHRK